MRTCDDCLIRACGTLAFVALVGVAHADELGDLESQGEAAAKAGDYSKAITMFKAADAQHPSAKYACLVALAYTRRELWPQAELFLARCRARATTNDPLPVWIDEADATLAAKLAAIQAAPITIVVTPQVPGVNVTVSSFESDESFPPRTIHLARGKHVVEVSAPGYVTASQTVVVDSILSQTIAIALHTPAEIAEAERLRALRQEPSRTPLVVIGAGGALAFAGLVYQLFVYKPERDTLANEPNHNAYAAEYPTFRRDRILSLGIYGAAAATIVVGAVLHYRLHDHSATVSASIAPGEAMLSLVWQR